MTKQTCTFKQWTNVLSEYPSAKEIAIHFDELTMFYHAGYDATKVSEFIKALST